MDVPSSPRAASSNAPSPTPHAPGAAARPAGGRPPPAPRAFAKLLSASLRKTALGHGAAPLASAAAPLPARPAAARRLRASRRRPRSARRSRPRTAASAVEREKATVTAAGGTTRASSICSTPASGTRPRSGRRCCRSRARARPRPRPRCARARSRSSCPRWCGASRGQVTGTAVRCASSSAPALTPAPPWRSTPRAAACASRSAGMKAPISIACGAASTAAFAVTGSTWKASSERRRGSPPTGSSGGAR